MSRSVFVLLIVVAVLSTAWGVLPPKKKCGKNEVWTNCGTMCQPSCGQKEPMACPAVCVAGCQCKSGYLRNSRKECVLPCDCDS